MPPFHTLSRAGDLKPGAVVLAAVRDPDGEVAPALVAQQFGRGHVAASMIGDLWRWGLRRRDPAEDDFDRAWRQTVRWLVADVPRRVDLELKPDDEGGSPAVRLTVRVRDPEFRPLDNAKVAVRVATPDGDSLTLDAEPDAREPGTYAATYATRQPGPHRFVAAATAPDGSALGDREAGWAAQPAADEFARLDPDRDFAETIAARDRRRGRRPRPARRLRRRPLAPRRRRSPSPGPRPSGTTRSTSSSPSPAWSPSGACGASTDSRDDHSPMSTFLVTAALALGLARRRPDRAADRCSLVVGARATPSTAHEFRPWADRWAEAGSAAGAAVDPDRRRRAPRTGDRDRLREALADAPRPTTRGRSGSS